MILKDVFYNGLHFILYLTETRRGSSDPVTDRVKDYRNSVTVGKILI